MYGIYMPGRGAVHPTCAHLVSCEGYGGKNRVLPGSAGFDSTRKREGARAIVRDRISRSGRRIRRWEPMAFRVYAAFVALVVVVYLLVEWFG